MAGLTPLTIIGIGLYIGVFAFFTWFCAIADPSTSRISYLLTESAPEWMSEQLSKVLGPEAMKVIHGLANRFLMIAYLCLVLGSWSIIFWFVYPWTTASPHVSNYHKIVGYVVFVCCMASWRHCATSHPGLITTKSLWRFRDNYPYDYILFPPQRKCSSTGLPRLPRSKYDRLKYHCHVARYDHFCGWVYNTIGQENYRWFLLFLAVHVVMCAYGTFVCGLLFRGEIDDDQLMELTFFDVATGEEFPATIWVVAQYMLHRHLLEASVLLLMGVMAVSLGGFLGYHIYITSFGMTSNEDSKWQQVRSWYKKEQRRYRQAVKEGKVKSDNNKAANPPEVSDGDVTCTGSNNTTVTSAPSDAADIFQDPGPIPKNIYNRGFVENWKEVLFPLSLREEKLKHYARVRRQEMNQPQPPQTEDALQTEDEDDDEQDDTPTNKAKAT